jgi:hypothetical protein
MDIEFDNVGAQRSDIGDVVLENGVCGNFAHQGTRSVSNLPDFTATTGFLPDCLNVSQ